MSQPIQVQVYEQGILPNFNIYVPGITYNIHYFTSPLGCILIDLPPLHFKGFEQNSQHSACYHLFLTSHFGTEALPLFLRQNPGMRVHCTNQCAKLLVRLYGYIYKNIDIQRETPVCIDNYVFYSLPTPLMPFPSSYFVFEATTKTLFSHFHGSLAGSTSQVNFKSEIMRFQQAFLPGARTFYRIALAQSNAVERVCPYFGKDWFKSEFPRLLAAAYYPRENAVFVAFTEQTRAAAHKLATALYARDSKTFMFNVSATPIYEAFCSTVVCATLVICTDWQNDDIEPQMAEFTAVMKQYHYFAALAAIVVHTDAQNSRQTFEEEAQYLKCRLVAFIAAQNLASSDFSDFADIVARYEPAPEPFDRFSFVTSHFTRFVQFLLDLK